MTWLTAKVAAGIGVAAALVIAGLLIWALWLRSEAVQLPEVRQQLQQSKDALAAEQRDRAAEIKGIQTKLQAEQAASADLITQRNDLTRRVTGLQEEIRHAPLTAPLVAPVAGKCPGHPVAGPQFERLYNAAARP